MATMNLEHRMGHNSVDSTVKHLHLDALRLMQELENSNQALPFAQAPTSQALLLFFLFGFFRGTASSV